MEIRISWNMVISAVESRLLCWLLPRFIKKTISVSCSRKASSLVDSAMSLLDELERGDNDES